jgi:hypothetical protein
MSSRIRRSFGFFTNFLSTLATGRALMIRTDSS